MKRLLSLSLALLLLLSLAAPALAEEETVRAVVHFDPSADPGSAAEALAETPGVTVLWRYDVLFSGAAVEAPASVAAALADAAGVESVSRTRRYARPRAEGGAPLATTNSLDLMGAEDLMDQGLGGDGLVIAVLDSGLRVSHEVFRDYGLAQAPALGREDVAAFVEGGGTPGRYLSGRIPFAYDYANRDDGVGTRDDHGTHVSALAVGYSENEDGSVRFRGAAPAAQLLSMKVFPDSAAGGADDAVVLKALEDAYALGADVINLSLGGPNGFTSDNALGGLYAEIFLRLREEGILLTCAAGNSGASTSFKLQGSALPTGGYTDYGTVNAPATYRGAAAVAAADAMLTLSAGSIRLGERTMGYADCLAEETSAPASLAVLAGRALPCVPVPGVGRPADYAGLDLTGKIALVERGEITFTEKVAAAAAAGAAACVIYNSAPGGLQAVAEDAAIPCGTISQADGAWLSRHAGEGTLTVSPEPFVTGGAESPRMLDASAWGTTSDLRLVPALTAPGGSILSAAAAGDSAYAVESGTSMAAPNAAGAYAVLLQALRQRSVTDRREAADLAEDLLLSTARLVADDAGTPLSPGGRGRAFWIWAPPSPAPWRWRTPSWSWAAASRAASP